MRNVLFSIVAAISVITLQAEPVFNIQSLSDAERQYLIDNKMWHEGCPVSLDQLRAVHVSYHDFDGKPHNDGLVVVIDQLAQPTLDIFRYFFLVRFPMNKVGLGTNIHDAPIASVPMSSSYNCRSIRGAGKWSLHAYGAAIDINPIQNPYLGITDSAAGIVTVSPPDGVQYLNRNNIRPGMIEPFVEMVQRYGFSVWGGRWNTPIDYQHFQATREQAEEYAKTARPLE